MGVDRKWAALTDERETLREERDALREQVARLTAERESSEEIRRFGLSLTPEEAGAMDALLFAYQTISMEWRLKANHGELTAAVHVIQGFVVQHMLQRLAPARWGSWYEDQPKEKESDGNVQDEVR